MELVTQTINSLTLGSDDDGTADDGTASNGADIENGRRHGGGHGSSHDHGRPCAGTGLDPSAPLVSAVIKMNIESSTTVEAEMAWIQGIGEALAQFEGFHSRKIINLPQTPASLRRAKVVLLKFRSYPVMRKWMDSPELAEWLAKGKAIGLTSERNVFDQAVGSVDVSQFAAPGATDGSSDWPKAPPKWKLSILIEFFVFFTVWTFAEAGVGGKIDAWINGDFGLALFLELCAVVPIIVYCLMPLATSLPLIKGWLARTRAPPSDEPWRTLDLGLSIFTPLPPPKPDAALVARLDALERKVDALKAKGAEYHADLVEAGLRKRLGSGDGDGLGNVGQAPAFTDGRQTIQPNLAHNGSEATAEEVFRQTGQGPQNAVEIRDEGEEVTVSATHFVKWECTEDFKRWTYDMAAAMSKAPGFLGSDVFHYDSTTAARVDPSTPHYNPEHVVLFRFASFALMETWITSEERERQLKRLLPLLEAPSHYGQIGGADGFKSTLTPRTHIVNAIDAFGELLASGPAEGGAPRSHPPVYKSAVLTVLGLFIVASPVNFNLAPELPLGMPLPVKVLTLTSINVIANTYIGLPLMSFFFGGWLQVPLPAGANPGWLHKVLVRGLPGWRSQVSVTVVYFALLVTSILCEQNGLLWFPAVDDDVGLVVNATSSQ